MLRARRVRTQAESTRGFRTNSQAPRESLLKGKPLNQCMIGIDMATQKIGPLAVREMKHFSFYLFFQVQSLTIKADKSLIFPTDLA